MRTPVDRFVLARLDHEQLSPSAEADRQTLLRRVTLDLTGLPPTPAEIDAFVADTAPGAYERVVDRLLASPHYGERWARPWLDLARYADTNGYEKDRRRDVWKYRDWVIDALNADMPFDRFTVEQIAGDMLPDATDAQRIATGFHRNAMTNEEGGVDPDESMYEVLVDRVNTTATVWLGTTLACAQCHNHKYDPFSQKDYFRLLAFFANPAYEKQVAGDGTRYYEAKLDLASPEQDAKRAAVQAEIKRLEGVLSETTPELADRQRAWEAEIRDAERAWTVLTPREATATGGVQLTPQPDGSILASGPNPELTTYTVSLRDDRRGPHRAAARGDARSEPAAWRPGPRRLRPLPRHRPGRVDRAASPAVPKRRSTSRRCRSTTRPPRSSPWTCWSPRGRAADVAGARGGSTRCARRPACRATPCWRRRVRSAFRAARA